MENYNKIEEKNPPVSNYEFDKIIVTIIKFDEFVIQWVVQDLISK